MPLRDLVAYWADYASLVHGEPVDFRTRQVHQTTVLGHVARVTGANPVDVAVAIAPIYRDFFPRQEA